ncbi:hypothetical protein [Rhodocytophaga rosea]|uniref:hypothetical protein n=1 Tax=Rhodocytophaga rosea TaxID=2704465 RepID=UPI0018D7343F|nr:hypothetical protein [Rhodocytophaga rosea]
MAAHGKLDRTQELLLQEPGLLNATWDWGAGDFETGLGGASHMGNREIANFLLSKGARMDIFTAAMLGKLEIIQTIIKIYPDMISCKGPHGISLLKHAKAGGKESGPVVAFLETQGAK